MTEGPPPHFSSFHFYAHGQKAEQREFEAGMQSKGSTSGQFKAKAAWMLRA